MKGDAKCRKWGTPPVFYTIVGGDPLEFCQDLWHQKLEFKDYGLVYIILHLALLLEHHIMTVGQTDGRHRTASEFGRKR